MIGGIKVERIQKTKFRKERDQENPGFKYKKKHHDKSTYRMMKEDDHDVELYQKENRRT